LSLNRRPAGRQRCRLPPPDGATGTIKRYPHNSYSTLNVNHRTRALARARELDVLDD
jgi:hypothetical protein